jgi:hypothetical protein
LSGQKAIGKNAYIPKFIIGASLGNFNGKIPYQFKKE